MKTSTMTMVFLLAAVLSPLPARAQVSVDLNVGIPLPPAVVFSAPPQMVVIPETYVYAVPDVEEDLYFARGWWWRPWQGRWYRSRHHDQGWVYYRATPPPFFRHVPPGWRADYREHRWKGREWKHQRVSHDDLHRNWRGWEKDKHWHKQGAWGVQGMEPRPQGPRGLGRDQRGGRHDVGPGRGGDPQRGPRGGVNQGPPGQARWGNRAVEPSHRGPPAGDPRGGGNRGPAGKPDKHQDRRGGHGRR